MTWKIPLAAVLVLLLFGIVVTLLNIGTASDNIVEVNLGFADADSRRDQYLDELVINALDKSTLGTELQMRLNKPSGTFVMGPLYVDRCEVSQLEYERFVEWLTTMRSLSADPARGHSTPEWLRSLSTGHRTAGRLNSPASGMSYQGAAAFCAAINGRLPTAEEAEAYARGQEDRLYPWGDEFNAEPWPYKEADRNASQNCGAFPDAATPLGIHDLANNVMEWSSGPRIKSSPEQFNLVAAHGAPATRARQRSLYALNSAWVELSPDVQSHHLGFRCVHENQPFSRYPWGTVAGDTVYIEPGHYRIGFPDDARVLHFAASVGDVQGLDLRTLVGDDKLGNNTIRVDQCEVTRAQYAEFLRDPLVMLGLYGNDNEPDNQDYVPLDWDEQMEQSARPVTGLSWWAADAYARWSGGRLPTSDEWRLIAAGDEALMYPWGDLYDTAAAATGDDADGNSLPCAGAPEDVTKSGVRHLAGNVSEWSRSLTVDRGTVAMWVHGGNWMLPGLETAQTVFARKVPLNHRSHTIGIRVVYD